MPFKLEPLTTVTIKETGGIRTTAFADNPAAWAVRPNNNSPEVQEWAYEKNLKTMQKPNHYFIGVRDDATGELVAYAHWRFSTPADRAKEAREDKDESEAYAPGCVREAQDEMNRGLDRSEEEVMGNVQDYWRKCRSLLYIHGTADANDHRPPHACDKKALPRKGRWENATAMGPAESEGGSCACLPRRYRAWEAVV